MTNYEWTDLELKKIQSLTDDLIKWMFHKPNDRHPIEQIIKEAMRYWKPKEKNKK